MKSGDTFGDYKVVRLLGKGGMGEVWLLEGKSGRQVAAKILEASADHESRKRFLREAQLALGVKHPNLVETYDVGEDPESGLCYILMEYVPGGTLADYIKANGALPIEDAVAVVEAIAGVLELGRQKGIVHRDIKPANIMFDAEGTPKLADLGIARAGSAGTETTTVTQTGAMIGTPAYMSPEQMLDSHNVDTRADIYSLGVVFFEMLTGQRPNKDDTIVQLMAKAVKGEPLPDVRTLRPEVSASLAQLLNMMVAPDKDGRISTPGQITNALAIIERGGEFADDAPVDATPSSRQNNVDATPSSRQNNVDATPSSRQNNVDATPSSRQNKDASVHLRRGGGAASTRARHAASPQKWLIPVLVLTALVGAFFFFAPKQNHATAIRPQTWVNEVVQTNVVKKTVVKTNVVDTVDLKKTAVANVTQKREPVRSSEAGIRIAQSNGYNWKYKIVEDGVEITACEKDDKTLFSAIEPTPAEDLAIPSSLDGRPVVSIGRWAFLWCKNLRHVKIPEGIVALRNRGVFFGCSSLESVSFPSSLKELSVCETFSWCSSLKEIEFAGEPPVLTDKIGRPATQEMGELFLRGVPADCTVRVRKSVGGWSHEWPVGFASRRQVVHGSEIAADLDSGKQFGWLTNPPSLKENAAVLVGYFPRYKKPEPYFSNVSPHVNVMYLQNKEIAACDLSSVALAVMFSCAKVDYGLEAQNVRRLLNQGIDVIFIAHTPHAVRESFLLQYGLRFDRMSKTDRIEGVCPGLRGLSVRWNPMGCGRILDENAGWQKMLAIGDDPRTVLLAVRRCGKGRLFFLANTNDLHGDSVDFAWWNRVMRGLGVALKMGDTADEHLKVNPDKLKDRDPTRAVQKTLDALFSGWKTSEVGESGRPGYWAERDGERNVLCTHPPWIGVPVTLSKSVSVFGKHPMLHVKIANNESGRQFRLRVRVNGKVLREKDIKDGWTDVYVALGAWRGKNVKIELDHMPTGWCREWAFWSAIEVVDDPNLVELERLQSEEKPVRLYEREKIEGTNPRKKVQRTCDVLFPRWKVSENGHLDEAGYEEEFANRYNNLLTHPPREDEPVVLSRRLTVPRENPKLFVSIANHPNGDFELQIKVNGKIIARPDIMGEGWKDLEFDLSPWAGRPIKIELVHMPTGWQQEWAHWNRIEVK